MSFLRGNQSVHFQVEKIKGIWINALSLDYLFRNRASATNFILTKPSVTLGHKFGIQMGEFPNPRIGIQQKIGIFIVYNLDNEKNSPDMVYEKKYFKYTVMGYIEIVEPMGNNWFYFFGMSLGWAVIFKPTYHIDSGKHNFNSVGVGELDLSEFTEHAHPEIGRKKNDILAFQLSLGLAYQLR